MNFDFTKAYDKQFQKLPQRLQGRVKASLILFVQDQTNPTLRNHALKGRWLGYYSISAGGDLRIHFKRVDSQTVLFVAVGTHSQLYK